MDDLDRRIVTALQRGIAVVPRPFAAAARDLGIDEATLILKLKNLLAQGALTRFGPLFNADRLGGAFTLCAMSVPAHDFERVCGIVNAFREVAHNYEREHRLNMWFVLATADPAQIAEVRGRIESATGYPVIDLPKIDEYFVGLELAA
ncbi:MAG: protein nirG [Betaproteobacteria bacterium RBG_16_66_20]|nr:MAG: protein nirG [Betaproteobacteria bacterium RBG_16_66_20]